MWQLQTVFLALALRPLFTMGAKSADEIKYLPGFDDKLPSKVYAGYLPAGSDEQDGTRWVEVVSDLGIPDWLTKVPAGR